MRSQEWAKAVIAGLWLSSVVACGEPPLEPLEASEIAGEYPGPALALPPPPAGARELADTSEPVRPGPSLRSVAWEDFSLDHDSGELIQAIDDQLRFLVARGEGDLTFGGRQGRVSRGRMAATLLALRDLVGDSWARPGFDSALRERFALYRSVGRESDGFVLFTGYYLPEYEASPVRTESFSVPLYARPAPTGRGRRRGYPTHAQIDKGALANRGLERAWVRHKLDRFFLMVQGSGLLRYPDGSLHSARYAGGNKKPYTAIGRLLVEDGKIPQAEISMQRIRQYFAKHPHEMDAYLYRCASFVFFRVDDVEPHGVHGINLTAFASMATDPRHFGTGLLGLCDYPRPTSAPESGPAPTRRAVHFACAQDVGGAIKGPDHIDVFCGIGDTAAVPAGFLQHPGRLHFIVLK